MYNFSRSPNYRDSKNTYSKRYGYGRSYSRSPPPRYRGGGGGRVGIYLQSNSDNFYSLFVNTNEHYY